MASTPSPSSLAWKTHHRDANIPQTAGSPARAAIGKVPHYLDLRLAIAKTLLPRFLIAGARGRPWSRWPLSATEQPRPRPPRPHAGSRARKSSQAQHRGDRGSTRSRKVIRPACRRPDSHSNVAARAASQSRCYLRVRSSSTLATARRLVGRGRAAGPNIISSPHACYSSLSRSLRPN